jgi:hypothetical protein
VARDEEQSFYQLKFNLAEAKKHRSGRCLGDMAQDTSKSKKPTYNTNPHPYDPMQLDAAKTQRLTDKECLKLIQEKKCFYCKETATCTEIARRGPRVKAKAKKGQKAITLDPEHRWPTQHQILKKNQVEKQKKRRTRRKTHLLPTRRRTL